MEKSFVFNSINGDRRYKAEDFREYFASFIGNGVFPNPSNNLQVTANNNMTVCIKQGKAWINGAIYENTDDLVINVDSADGILNRVDRIVLRMDTVQRKIYSYVKKGQLASSPIASSLQRDSDAYEIALADVKINAGAIRIIQADITDLRFHKELCGLVHTTVEQIDSTIIFNQFQNWYKQKQDSYDKDISTWTEEKKQSFDTWYATNTRAFSDQFNTWYNTNTNKWTNDFYNWFDTIKTALDGNVAGNLLNKIDAIPIVKTSFDEPTELRTGDFWLKEV